jgi:hypothetical protein
MMTPPIVKGFKQNNLDCGVLEGAEKSDEKSDSTLEMENRFRAAGIGASEYVYMHLYLNRWDLVNHNRESMQPVIS